MKKRNAFRTVEYIQIALQSVSHTGLRICNVIYIRSVPASVTIKALTVWIHLPILTVCSTFHSCAPRFLLMWCNLLLFCFDLYLLWFAAVNFVSFSQIFPFLCKDLRHPACLFVLNIVRRYPIEHSERHYQLEQYLSSHILQN